MMTTVYANEERPIRDYSSLLEEALIRLRRELRSDLQVISEINWDKKESDEIIEDFASVED